VAAESLHLTLRFVGNTAEDVVDRLSAELRLVPVKPFEVGIGGLGNFGRGRMARVAWLGVQRGEEGLRSLAAAVEGRCQAVGLAPESRPYSPHLTLARARTRAGAALPALPDPPRLESFTVDHFRLYRSRTGRGGSVYSVLEEFR
jgi:2'-5' RNA ligase